jgi:filamentous hemagglutinin family protein
MTQHSSIMCEHSRTQRRWSFIVATTLAVYAQVIGAQTLPTGAVVAAGSARLTPISPNLLTIQQSSNRAVIDWNTFSIGSGARVDFQQPNSSAAALNLVAGSQSSKIDGQLTGNGRVYLLNPSGVLIGDGAQVNTGSFIAAAATVTPGAAVLWQQGSNSLALTSGTGVIRNDGKVVVQNGGFLGLAGPAIVQNGLLYAKLGKVQLAAGSAFTLDFAGDGLISVTTGLTQYPQGLGPNDSPVNIGSTGQISAEGGTIAISTRAAQQLFANVIGVDGKLWAQNASVTGNVIELTGSGGGIRIGSGASLDASSTTGAGGGIALVGDSIALQGNSIIATTGMTGGGPIALTATTGVSSSSASQLVTSSTSSGPAGDVVISGPTNGTLAHTDLAGTVIATSVGGEGGSFSVTAAELAFNSLFATTRPGTGSVPALRLTTANGITVDAAAPSSSSSFASSTQLGNALASGADVALTSTAGTLTVDGRINGRPGTAAATGGALTLTAAGDLLLNDVITTQGSGIKASAGGALTMGSGASLQVVGVAVPSVCGSASVCLSGTENGSITVNDVQATGELQVSTNGTGPVVFNRALGGTNPNSPSLGGLRVIAPAAPVQLGNVRTDTILVANVMDIQGVSIVAAGDLQSSSGSITLRGPTTIEGNIFTNGGAITVDGDLTLDPQVKTDSFNLYTGVPLGTANETSPPLPPTYNRADGLGTPYFSGVTVNVPVYGTTIRSTSSSGSGPITFAGNVDIAAGFKNTLPVNNTIVAGIDCTPASCPIVPQVNLVVNAGSSSVVFVKGFANYLTNYNTDNPANPLLLQSSQTSPGVYGNGNYDSGSGVNTAQLDVTGGKLTVGSPGGTSPQPSLWVNQFSFNNIVATPTAAPLQVVLIAGQKVNVLSAAIDTTVTNPPSPTFGEWILDGGNPPAPNDSRSSGIILNPTPGSQPAGVPAGSNPPAPTETTPGSAPSAPGAPNAAPSAPLGTSASEGELAAAQPAQSESATPVDTTAYVVFGRGIGAEADFGQTSATAGAAPDIFARRHHVVRKVDCPPQAVECLPVADPDYLKSDVHR